MTEFVWSAERAAAIRLFDGEAPEQSTEDEIFKAFMVSPVAVLKARDETAEAKRAGKVRSGWAIWRRRVASLHNGRDGTVSDESERDRALAAARCWLRHAGVHFDRPSELEEELFGPYGSLRGWADDAIRQEMLGLWRQSRQEEAA